MTQRLASNRIFLRLRDIRKQNYNFADFDLCELRFVSGEATFPSDPFRPNYSTKVADFGREYASLYGASGIPALSYKSDYGLGRISYVNYKSGFCLYKVSLTRLVTETDEYEGPSHVEARQNCSSLDGYLKFSKAPTTSLAFVCMFIYSDSLEISKDENSDRTVLLNYPL